MFNPCTELSDDDLIRRLDRLVRSEREIGADIILHLMVINERRLYAPAGFASLFSYMTDKLGFS